MFLFVCVLVIKIRVGLAYMYKNKMSVTILLHVSSFCLNYIRTYIYFANFEFFQPKYKYLK